MEVGILSMRYAKAMIEYAQEKGVEDRVYQEFLMLSYSFCAQPGLREALENPVITMKEQLELTCKAVPTRSNGKPPSSTYRHQRQTYRTQPIYPPLS